MLGKVFGSSLIKIAENGLKWLKNGGKLLKTAKIKLK
jgi:hypothetical protein